MDTLTIQEGSQQITGDLEVLGSINNAGIDGIKTDVETAKGDLQIVASTVVEQWASLADDAVITTAEKKTIRDVWHGAETEYPLIHARGVEAGVPVAGYEAAYEALRVYLYGEPGILLDMATPSDVDRAEYTAAFGGYTEQRETLLAAIGTAAYESIGLAGITLKLGASQIIRSRDGNISPSELRASAQMSDGVAYNGRYALEITTDLGLTWVLYAGSTEDELSHTFIPPAKVGNPEVFIDAVRVSLYAAGGTSMLLREKTVPIVLDSAVKPIYFRALTSPPESPITNDSYFDGNPIASGGGVIRYYTGTEWAIATSLWPMWGEVWAQAMDDAFVWQAENQVQLEETVKMATAVAKAMAQKQIVAALPLAPYDGYEVGDVVVLTGDSKVYRLTGTGWTAELDGQDIAAGSITSGKINCVELSSAVAFIDALEASTAYIEMLGTNTVLAQHIGANTAFINSFIAQDVVLGTAEAYLSILPGAPGTSASPKIKLAAGNDYIKLTNAGIEFRTSIFDVQSSVSSFTSMLESKGFITQRYKNIQSGISFYRDTYTAWQMYMAQAGVANQGYKGNVTPPASTLVTSWGLRSLIEASAGYGWTFETIGATASGASTVVAEISSSDGSARFGGILLSAASTKIGTTADTDLLALSANKLTVNGKLQIGASDSYFEGTASYFQFRGSKPFYIMAEIPVTYIYSHTIYLGNTSGCTINFRANTITGTGSITGGTVWGAVGNDVADRLDIEADDTAPGYVVVIRGGRMTRASRRADRAAVGIVSDTASLVAGDASNRGLPVAVAGFVLAYVDAEYPAGTRLTCAADGRLTKATRSDPVLAAFVSTMDIETWNGKPVNGRMLVKVV